MTGEYDGNQYLENAFSYASKASTIPKDSEQRNQLFDIYLAEVNDLLQNDEKHMQLFFSKGHILFMDGRDLSAAIKCFEQLRTMNTMAIDNSTLISKLLDQSRVTMIMGDEEEADRLMTEAELLALETQQRAHPTEILLSLAEAYQGDSKWMKAMDVYRSLLEQMYDETQVLMTPPQQRRIFMVMSQCLYELGKYEQSIECGTAAIEMNRHFTQVHKYVALAQKASGHLEASITTMKRAVLYETP